MSTCTCISLETKSSQFVEMYCGIGELVRAILSSESPPPPPLRLSISLYRLESCTSSAVVKIRHTCFQHCLYTVYHVTSQALHLDTLEVFLIAVRALIHNVKLRKLNFDTKTLLPPLTSVVQKRAVYWPMGVEGVREQTPWNSKAWITTTAKV